MVSTRPIIQLWHSAENENVDLSDVYVVRDTDILIPDSELSTIIQESWNEYAVQNTSATNNTIPFLHAIESAENVKIVVQGGPFSYAYFFGRTSKGHEHQQERREHRAIHLSTHVLLLSTEEDGSHHALYAEKKSFGKQVYTRSKLSGFGGFPRLNPASNEVEKLDYTTILENRLIEEIGRPNLEQLSHTQYLGTTYVNIPGFSGADLNFAMTLDLPLQDMIFNFPESDQFIREFTTSAVTPDEFARTIDTINASDMIMSPYAQGCAAQYVISQYGVRDAQSMIDTINEQTSIGILKNPEYLSMQVT